MEQFDAKEKRELTGYPHIDKMWEKYYDADFLKQPLPENTLNGYLKNQTKGFDNYTALNYYGNKISYGELYENIDSASKVLSSLGVGYDDKVMYLMPNIPETAYLFYGTSQVGGISDYVDPRPDSVDLNISAQKLLKLVIREKIKMIVALDQCYLAMIRPIEKELKELGIENIVIVSAKDSMKLNPELLAKMNPTDIKALEQKMAQTKKMEEMLQMARSTSALKVMDYKQILMDTKYATFAKVPYVPDKIDAITHTSGTSSPIPKPIPLTNDNLNKYVHQTYGANMNMGEKDKGLHILPYFAAFGLANVLHAGLCRGWELIEIPEFSPANLGKMIIEHQPQIIIGTPTWFINMMNDPALKDADLSCLKMITYGGDSMEAEDEINLNKFLQEHNSSISVTKGHGMSETSGCASYATNDYNDVGIMGIPMPNTIYAVVNPETKELLKFEDGIDYLEGELIISSPAITKGILNGEVIVPHGKYDGLDFIYTRDLATMDRNGKLKFLSRIDRSFTRYDGFKVKPYEIEGVLKQDERIKSCIISPYLDSEKYGFMIKATIVLEDGVELSTSEQVDFVRELVEKYFIKNPDVSSRQLPSKFVIKDELPQTKNGKVDFNSLAQEELTGDEITVVLEETNLSVGNIQIIPPQKSQTLTRNKLKG